MNKRIWKMLSLLLILSLIFAGCGPKRANESSEKGTVFMWEVSPKEGGGKLYLLGSIHAGSDDLYPLNNTITKAFESSDILAVECDVTTLLERPNYLDLMKKVMYTDGTSIKDHIPSDLYDKTSGIMSDNGISIEMIKNYKPFMVASMILSFKMSEWGYEENNGIDTYFIGEAKKKGMAVAEIESLEFQFDMLGGFSDEIQIIMLRSAVEGLESSKNYMDDMFSYWLKGDVKGFEDFILQEDPSMTDEEMDAFKDYEKQMFDDRNTQMTGKAEEYLKSGKTYFFVVGSAHMVGDTGIVRQLIDKGYKVEQK